MPRSVTLSLPLPYVTHLGASQFQYNFRQVLSVINVSVPCNYSAAGQVALVSH